MSSILFPLLGVRLTTWICVIAFAALAARRRDVLPLLAAWVWLIGFEAAFDAFGLATVGYAADRVLPIVLGVFTLAWCARTKILRVSLPWVVVTALVWAAWLAVGFHWNSYYTSAADFRWHVEVLNEAAKTSWALAYLVPLVSAGSAAAGEWKPAASASQPSVQ